MVQKLYVWIIETHLEGGDSTADTNDLSSLKMLDGLYAVQRQVLTLFRAGCSDIAIILPNKKSRDVLSRALLKYGVRFLQQGEEAKKDVAKMHPCSRILLSSTQYPLFSVETVKNVIDDKSDSLVPVYQGKRGFPLVLPASLASIAAESCTVEQLLRVPTAEYCTNDAGVVWNSQTDPLSDTLLESNDLKSMRVQAKVTLARESVFFGPGTRQLLNLVQKTLSFRSACQQMGLSISKGWKIILDAESQLGYPLLERQQGGSRGGGSKLTPQGKVFLERYEAFEAECQQKLLDIFNRHFDNEA